MNYHFSECLDVSRQPREGDDCEFTVADDPNHAGQLMATRYFFYQITIAISMHIA